MNEQNALFEAWIERLPTATNIHMSAGDRLDDDFTNSNRIPYSDKHNHFYKMLMRDSVSKSTMAYTSNLSGDLNRSLIHLSTSGQDKMPKKLYHMMERDINMDIHGAPSPTEDLYVYSGIKNFTPNNLHSRYIHAPNFVSASLLPHIAKEFAQTYYTRNFDGRNNDIHHLHVLRIKIPAFSNNGLYLANHSAYPKEEEFLLRNSNVYHIADTPHTFINNYGNGSQRHIHLWDTHIIEPSEFHKLSHESAIQDKLYLDDKLEKNR